MEIKIQSATIKNLKDIQNLNKQLCIKENKEFDSTIDPSYPLKKAGAKYFQDRIKTGCALVAIKDSKVVGYLIGAIAEPADYRTVSKVAEAENMFVIEECRSLGIGKRLFDEFVKWSKKNNAKIIRATASTKNNRAIEFYRKEGLLDYDLTLEKQI